MSKSKYLSQCYFFLFFCNTHFSVFNPIQPEIFIMHVRLHLKVYKPWTTYWGFIRGNCLSLWPAKTKWLQVRYSFQKVGQPWFMVLLFLNILFRLTVYLQHQLLSGCLLSAHKQSMRNISQSLVAVWQIWSWSVFSGYPQLMFSRKSGLIIQHYNVNISGTYVELEWKQKTK